jgi:uroporphyrinogen decarboxylase
MFAHLREPNFERLTKTLFGGQADCVPLIELGIHPRVKEDILGKPVASVADEAEFMRSMGYDFVKIQPKISFEVGEQKVEDSGEGYANAPDRAWAPEHGGVISSWEDFEKYPWPRVEDIDYSRFEEARGALPDGMGVIGQYGDVFTLAWELMGFENYAMKTFEDPELVKALTDKVGEIVLSMFETMSDMDWVGALWLSDDVAFASGTLLSPDFFREYFFPILAKAASHAKKRKIPFIYHTDGLLWDVLDDIVDSGVNALHPIEPKAMDIREVKAKYGEKLCLCGGIEVDVIARGSKEEMIALTEKILADVAPGGGWCAGSSNSVPDYAKTENYVAMVETILKNGTY